MIPSDWPDRAHSEFHAVDGLTWHLQRSGRAPHEAPTVLLVHGTGGSTHSWAGVVPMLAPSFHVVNLDLPGHGFTEVPPEIERARNPFALAGMARAVHGLLGALDIRPQIAVGHSAGVSVLLRLLVDGQLAPESVVGICPALVAPPNWYVTLVAPLLGLLVEREVVADTTARLAAGTRLIERMLGSTGTRLTAEQAARYRHLCTRPGHVHAAITMMSRWDLPALFRDVGVLHTPIHLVAARGDRWIPLASLTRAVTRLPGVTLQAVDGGHLLPEERPEVVVAAIRSSRPAASDGSPAHGPA
jgi:magnesium chelatase accessory protein